ncbi:N-acetylglucosamine kinase [Paractinoplanes globisporus]|uniref:N-acetylglucosamine kinase n=1 Tax=Paractinoplanes globisporus TaxID=113565 RepID=A0ABW6WAT0_9ACTN|nr:BadF/BadG/BcrA/BcrD ATPase family protein [Actinoplanes globisporus]
MRPDGVAYVGIDVGGGGIRIRAQVHGRRMGVHDQGPVPRAGGRIDAPALGARIGGLVAGMDPGLTADRVAVGLTGMPGLLERPAELAGHLHRRIASRTVIIAGDSLTTHLGALRGRAGCVVAAGTGVIVLGTDHAATWNRVDGWGHLLGDEGSGAWIGARGLRAALRHHDGRDEASAALHHRLRQRFGTVDDALHAIYGSAAPAHELAAFAPDVAAAAHDGDPVARQIWRRAGAHLAAAAQAAGHGLPPEYSWGGRLFDAGELLLDAFRDDLARRVPGARLSPPSGQAADGALLLAQRGLPPDRPTRAPYAVEFPPIG